MIPCNPGRRPAVRLGDRTTVDCKEPGGKIGNFAKNARQIGCNKLLVEQRGACGPTKLTVRGMQRAPHPRHCGVINARAGIDQEPYKPFIKSETGCNRAAPTSLAVIAHKKD